MSQELSEKEITNAFEKLNITSEKENPIKENIDDLNNALKIMILDSVNKLWVKKTHKHWWRYTGRFHITTNNSKSTFEQKDSKRLWFFLSKQHWLKRNRTYPKNQVR